MDIPVTLLSVFLVYVGVKYLNEVFPKGVPSLLKIPAAIALGIGAAFLLAQCSFANQIEYFKTRLDLMNGGDLVVLGIVLGAGAVGLDTTFKTIRNVGENDVPTT